MNVSMYDLGQRFVGIKEVPGKQDNPMILAMLKLDGTWPEHDEVPWCSAFVNFLAWLLRLPRSKSLRARSWLLVGRPITLVEATPGNDVVVFKRGGKGQPGPDVIEAPGHVGLYAGHGDGHVMVLGGNQSDSVSLQRYPIDQLLGVRSLNPTETT